MRKYKLFWVGLFWTFGISFLNAQQLTFKLNHDEATNLYEVFAVPDSTNALYFVGGGSQLTIVLPQDIADQPLSITTVNGGPWTDNSYVFGPSDDHIHDFHGIASNGARVSFTEGEPLLLFTFELPNGECRSDVRLYENTSDIDHSAISMNGSDFRNFVANVFIPFKNNWTANENTTTNSCAAAPTVASSALQVDQDQSGTICLTIEDLNNEDYFNVSICETPTSSFNGNSIVTVSENIVCLEYTPNTSYVGIDEVCIEVCDQTGLCNNAFVAINVIPEVIYSTFSATNEACTNLLNWTIAQPNEFSHFELQRSQDGLNYNVIESFESINQTTDLQFGFTDIVVDEDYFYRLKLVFNNDNHQFSEAVFVSSNCDESSFYATLTGESNFCTNHIQWTINDLSAVRAYQLQRSNEGSNFEVLESNEQVDISAFSFTDRATKGDHYYRLKLFFEDGTATVTNPVFVESDCVVKEGDFVLFPNPASHHTEVINIKYFATIEKMNLIVTDPLGRVMRRLNLEIDTGVNTIKLDIAKFPSGTYFVTIEGEEVLTKSFVKLNEF